VTGSGLRRDDGSAIVEFCFLSVLMLVPLVYLVTVLGRVQAAALAAETAAREAGRAFVTAPSEDAAGPRARVAAAIAFADQGFGRPDDGAVELTGSHSPCLVPDVRTTLAASDIPLMKGGLTPTEVLGAAAHGAAKLFPAHVGGVSYLRSLLAVAPHARIMPTGGIPLASAAEWLAAGAFAVGIGSDLTAPGDIAARVAEALDR